MEAIKNKLFYLISPLTLSLTFLFLLMLLSEISGAESVFISVDKTECFVFDEVNINVTIIPNHGGSYAYISLTRVNVSDDVLFSHQKGCITCGTFKSPLTSETLKKFKKNFTSPGLYKVWGEVTDANTYERNFTEVAVLVKEKKVNLNNSSPNNSNLNITSNISNTSNASNAPEISNISPCLKTGLTDAYFFYGEGCSGCISAESLVNEMCLKYNISFKFYEIFGSPGNEMLLEDFSERYCIPKEETEVPSIFIGDTALVGEKEIKEKLEEKIVFFAGIIEKSPPDPIKVNKTCFETPLYQKPPEKKPDKPDEIPVIAVIIIFVSAAAILAGVKYFRSEKR